MTQKERPILFSGEMVRAILDGRKTMTRRVVRLPVIDRNSTGCEIAGCEINGLLGEGRYDICPHGEPGDFLWVRETWREVGGLFDYRARIDDDRHYEDTDAWRPSIFMPREASRLTLEIVSIRAERLQKISEEDAKAEGITHSRLGYSGPYRLVWDSLNEKRGFGWATNPWVWVIEFRKL